MKTLNLLQGSPEWHAHRATHFNASDAPAMLGVSPYKTRAQLLREYFTGIAPEIDAATQRRFDDGHRFEALARPRAEEIIGEELFPCVGEDGELSASFDGLTLDMETAFEHKTLNAELRDAIRRHVDGTGSLHVAYLVQMEQQCMVSGARRVLFCASKWDGDELLEFANCWYSADEELRKEIIAGWAQFKADLAAYQPEPTKPSPVATVVEGFGALSLRVEGRVLASNLDAFKAGAEAFIARLPKPTDLQTDQDFADADAAVKACAEAEARIKAAKDAAQSQMDDVDAAFRLADTVIETIRRARLALDKVVESEKIARKGAIVTSGVEAVRKHYIAINATLGEHALGMPAGLHSDIAAAMKGLKSLSSMRDKVDAAAANAKIAASQKADAIRANIAVIAANGCTHAGLFPDHVQLCATKSPDDLRNLIAARIAEHEKREADRIAEAQERGRLMAEAAAKREADRIELEQKAAGAPAAQQPLHESAHITGVATGSRNDSASESVTRGSLPPTLIGKRIKLGDICNAIAPLSITADGLAQLGFNAVGHERSAKLYSAADFGPICSAIATRVDRARLAGIAEKAA